MRVIIRKKMSYYSVCTLFTIIIVLDLIIGSFIVTLLEVSDIRRFDDLLTICLLIFLLLLVNLYLINYIVWQFRGCETVEMTDKILSIKRSGKLFNDNSIISINKIEKIKEQEKYDPSKFSSSIWRNPFMFSKITGEEGGKIRVIYNTKVICFKFKIALDFGQGLSKEEARLYIQMMNEILSEKHSKNEV